MKKTLIALMALTGVVSAETYYFVGSDGAWTEEKVRWESEEGVNPNANGGWTDTGTGNKFIVGDTKKAQSGTNMTFANTTLEIQNGGTLTATGETKFNNTSINIADGGVFTSTTSGGGIKLKDVTINTNSNVTLHRLTFQGDMGNITFNLGNEGKIFFGRLYF